MFFSHSISSANIKGFLPPSARSTVPRSVAAKHSKNAKPMVDNRKNQENNTTKAALHNATNQPNIETGRYSASHAHYCIDQHTVARQKILVFTFEGSTSILEPKFGKFIWPSHCWAVINWMKTDSLLQLFNHLKESIYFFFYAMLVFLTLVGPGLAVSLFLKDAVFWEVFKLRSNLGNQFWSQFWRLLLVFFSFKGPKN